MTMRISLLAIVALALGFSACRGSRNESGDLESSGTVQYVDLEGGFYGIVTDDGHRWDPTNLSDEFKVDGLRVRVRATPATGRMGTHMWGTIVEIEEIERL